MMNDTTGPILQVSAQSLDKCREILYNMYGKDYQILDHRIDFKGGIFGFFQKEVVTVNYVQLSRQMPDVKKIAGPISDERFAASQKELLNSLRPSGDGDNYMQFARLSKQLENMEKRMNDSISEIAQNTQKTDEHKNIAKIRDILSDNEFSQNYINTITSRINREFSIDDLDDFDAMQRSVISWIGEDIRIAPPVRERVPKVILIVGPTGVGKTTTIAKFAASVLMDHHKKNQGTSVPVPKIRMITTDIMRVGAEEQIKNWGETMSIPVDKAERASDLVELFDLYKNSADYIFVDTSGYSPNDFESIAKMRSLLDVKGMDANIYLAFSATSKPRDIINIIRNYEVFNYKGIIVTKCDESACYGNVISALAEESKRIAFITDGQNVVENRSVSSIRKASKLWLLRTISGINVNNDYLEAKFPEENTDSLI